MKYSKEVKREIDFIHDFDIRSMYKLNQHYPTITKRNMENYIE